MLITVADELVPALAKSIAVKAEPNPVSKRAPKEGDLAVRAAHRAVTAIEADDLIGACRGCCDSERDRQD